MRGPERIPNRFNPAAERRIAMEIVGSAGLDPAAVAPVAAPRHGEAMRFVTLDAIRGFAVFGILLRNIFLFGLPASAYALPFL
jgi:hypothetical protein